MYCAGNNNETGILMFDDLTLTHVRVRVTEFGDLVDLYFESDLKGVLNTSCTVVAEEVANIASMITKTYDREPAKTHIANAILEAHAEEIK